MTSACLDVSGTIAGGVTLNPVVLGTISGSGVLLKTRSEIKNYRKKIEPCRFAYISYEKILIDLRSFMGQIMRRSKLFNSVEGS